MNNSLSSSEIYRILSYELLDEIADWAILAGFFDGSFGDMEANATLWLSDEIEADDPVYTASAVIVAARQLMHDYCEEEDE